MKIELEFPFSEDDLEKAKSAAEGGDPGPLRGLCQKETSRFEAMLRQHPEYSDGLVKIERLAVEGYLYQKIRGHVDATSENSNHPLER